LRQDALLQLALAIAEKLVECRFYACRRDDGRPVAAVAQRRPHLDENIVAGRLRVGVRPMKMDVAGCRAVEAVGKIVESGVEFPRLFGVRAHFEPRNSQALPVCSCSVDPRIS
jgi:hypothetical protein